MQSIQCKASWLVSMLVLFVVVCPMMAVADEPDAGEQTPAASPSPAEIPQSTAGMRVVIDPETGELRVPTPEEAAELFGIPEGQAPEKSEAQTPAIRKADGSLLLQFRGSFLKAAVATVGEDGKVEVKHHATLVQMPEQTVVHPPVEASQTTSADEE